MVRAGVALVLVTGIPQTISVVPNFDPALRHTKPRDDSAAVGFWLNQEEVRTGSGHPIRECENHSSIAIGQYHTTGSRKAYGFKPPKALLPKLLGANYLVVSS